MFRLLINYRRSSIVVGVGVDVPVQVVAVGVSGVCGADAHLNIDQTDGT